MLLVRYGKPSTIVDLGVLNMDFHCATFFVNPNNSYRVQMLEFGIGEFGEHYESEYDWKTE